jgi:hypothetical protein
MPQASVRTGTDVVPTLELGAMMAFYEGACVITHITESLRWAHMLNPAINPSHRVSATELSYPPTLTTVAQRDVGPPPS